MIDAGPCLCQRLFRGVGWSETMMVRSCGWLRARVRVGEGILPFNKFLISTLVSRVRSAAVQIPPHKLRFACVVLVTREKKTPISSS